MKPRSDAIKASRKEQDVRAAIGRGVIKERAERAAARKFDAGVLLGSEIIKFADEKHVSVSDLLSPSGEEYDQLVCYDPVEPGYDGGRPVGKFFWNGGMRPGVCSFAHGQRFYRFAYDADTARKAIDQAENKQAMIPLILALADLNPVERPQIEKYAAQALGLGNSRKALRESVQEQRAEIASYHVEHDTDNDCHLVDQIATTSLRERLPPTSFPQTKVSERGVQVLDHQDNIAHLLDRYGINYHYNLISKDFEWAHDDISSTGDHAAISLQSQLKSLCALNSVPSFNLHLHMTALGERAEYNPVVDHLSSLKWDGVPRFDKLADAMEADDVKTARIALRLFLVQACAAADHSERHPNYRGHFEGVLVFVGAQGIGKTNGLFKLFPATLRATCFKEGQVLDTKNKDSIKAVISAWCCELGELDGTFRKSDVAALKAFLSQERDEIRLPYAPTASVFRRRTVFVGTVNDATFLADTTGNRRFWPLTVTRVDVGWDDEEVDQLWAEAWGRYLAGEKWWPTPQEEELLAANAERYRSKSLLEQSIEDRFEWDAPPDWHAGRQTVQALYLELNSGGPTRYEQAELKKIGNALRRLWKQSSYSEVWGGVLCVRNCEGGFVKLNSEGGKNRGWLLPPRRRVQRSASNAPGHDTDDGSDQEVKG